MKKLFVIVFLGLLAGCAGTQELTRQVQRQAVAIDSLSLRVDVLTFACEENQAQVEERLLGLDSLTNELNRRLENQRWTFAAYTLPSGMTFFEKHHDFDTPDKKQRLEREVLQLLGSPARLYIYFLNSQVYFPIIEGILLQDSLPDDMKYVAVIESALQPDAKSSAGARGFWQFMPTTARRYNLTQNDLIDLTRDLENATTAAGRYFYDLDKHFHGDWPLKLAGYNDGEGNVLKLMRQQEAENYFDLWLPKETEAYVFRIMAVKLIFESPSDFGVNFQSNPNWEPLEKDTATVKLAKGLSVLSVAKMCGTTYREIKKLNPEVLKDAWGSGQHTIGLPLGARQQFLDGLTALRGQKKKR